MRRLARIVVLAAVVGGTLWFMPKGFALNTVLTLFSRVAADGGVRTERGIAYGPNERHRLDVYTPAASDQTGPIVLFLYGGSWRSGERGMYGFVGAALAARGITTVIPDYRLYPETQFPGFVEDAALAYAYVAREMVTEKKRPIVVVGHSTGAYMAAMLVLDAGYLDRVAAKLPRPAGLVGLAGPYAFDPTTWPSTKDVFANVRQADSARPVTFAGAHAPPALLMHGLADETVKLYNTRDLAAALEKSGVRVEHVEIDGLGHFGLLQAMARGFRWRAPVLERVVGFVGTLNVR